MLAPHGRTPTISPPAHQLYRALIDTLLATGTLPDDAALATATGLGDAQARAALDELVAADWAGRDEGDALVALYPFSIVPTATTGQLDGAERHAMCAIDALGIAPMLGQTTTIRSTCPVSDTPLTLTVTPDGIQAHEPPTLAVIYRRATGPAHLNRCGATRFFRSPADGHTWLASHGGPADTLLTPAEGFARAPDLRPLVSRRHRGRVSRRGDRRSHARELSVARAGAIVRGARGCAQGSAPPAARRIGVGGSGPSGATVNRAGWPHN